MQVTSSFLPFRPLPDFKPNSCCSRLIERISAAVSYALRWLCCRLASCLGYVVNGFVTNAQLKAKLVAAKIAEVAKDGIGVKSTLSIPAKALIFHTFQKFDQVSDIHLHILGYDDDNYLNPELDKGSQGIKWSVIHCGANGSISREGSTARAIERLQLYAQHFPKFKGTILPIDFVRAEDGKADLQRTASYLGNSTVQLAAKGQPHLQAAASIHPKDPNWKIKLAEAHAQGIRLIKWYPPQGIDPRDNCTSFYEEMKKLGMRLIAHSGHSHALSLPKEWEHYGDPENFKEALQIGVEVILAHCGGEESVDQFEKFSIEAKDKEWKGKLYGDLSGAFHKNPEFIAKLMSLAQNPKVNIVYGSDYPYTNLGKAPYDFFVTKNWLNKKDVAPLKEIRELNPLLANFLAMANLTINGKQFSAKVFTESSQ